MFYWLRMFGGGIYYIIQCPTLKSTILQGFAFWAGEAFRLFPVEQSLCTMLFRSLVPE
jgi:hypothetical protein